MSLFSKYLVIFVVLIFFAPVRSLAAESAPPVSSTSQKGGVTAGAIGVLNYGQNDPLRDRLGTIMASYNKSFFENVEAAIQISYFVIFVNQNDPAFGSSDEHEKTYSFFAGSDLDLAELHVPKCQVMRGVSVLGAKVEVLKSSPEITSELSYLPAQDPLLQKICSALSMPASVVYPKATSLFRSSQAPTLYEMLNRSDFVIVRLLPVKNKDMAFDAAVVRGYWAGAFFDQFNGPPLTQDSLDIESRSELSSALMQGKSIRMSQNLPPFSFLSGIDYSHPYPLSLEKEYAGRIETMDAAWQRFLGKSSISLGGNSVPVLQGHSYQKLLTLYDSSDLETTEFWRHISDTNRLFEQLNCLGAEFAVEESYAKSIDLPAFGRCMNWRIQIPQ